jgi:hypothetical protein
MSAPCHTLKTYQGVSVSDEGVLKAVDAISINFVGPGVTATSVDRNVTVTIPTIAGPAGPVGPASTVPGPVGPASTVPGPVGPASTVPGPVGPASTVPGPAGPPGPAGISVVPVNWVWDSDKNGGAILELSDGSFFTIPPMPSFCFTPIP